MSEDPIQYGKKIMPTEFNIQDLELNPQYSFIGKEKDIETHILENISDISACCMWGDVKRVERQYPITISGGRIFVDIMLWHTDGTGTAIEVKRSKTNRNDLLTAIGQSLFYGYKMEKSLNNMARLVIAAPVINKDLYEVVKRFKLPINLLMVDGDRCIYLGNG